MWKKIKKAAKKVGKTIAGAVKTVVNAVVEAVIFVVSAVVSIFVDGLAILFGSLPMKKIRIRAARKCGMLNCPLDFFLGLMIAVNQTASRILSANLGREEVLPIEFG